MVSFAKSRQVVVVMLNKFCLNHLQFNVRLGHLICEKLGPKTFSDQHHKVGIIEVVNELMVVAVVVVVVLLLELPQFY